MLNTAKGKHLYYDDFVMHNNNNKKRTNEQKKIRERPLEKGRM